MRQGLRTNAVPEELRSEIQRLIGLEETGMGRVVTRPLTERVVREARPRTATYTVWDSKVRGLGLRVTPAGVRSYLLDYRIAGRRRRATLARCSELSLMDVRERAGRELVAIRAGEADPLERRRQQREAPTVDEGLDRFLDEYAPERMDPEKAFPQSGPAGFPPLLRDEPSGDTHSDQRSTSARAGGDQPSDNDEETHTEHRWAGHCRRCGRQRGARGCCWQSRYPQRYSR